MGAAPHSESFKRHAKIDKAGFLLSVFWHQFSTYIKVRTLKTWCYSLEHERYSPQNSSEGIISISTNLWSSSEADPHPLNNLCQLWKHNYAVSSDVCLKRCLCHPEMNGERCFCVVFTSQEHSMFHHHVPSNKLSSCYKQTHHRAELSEARFYHWKQVENQHRLSCGTCQAPLRIRFM